MLLRYRPSKRSETAKRVLLFGHENTSAGYHLNPPVQDTSPLRWCPRLGNEGVSSKLKDILEHLIAMRHWPICILQAEHFLVIPPLVIRDPRPAATMRKRNTSAHVFLDAMSLSGLGFVFSSLAIYGLHKWKLPEGFATRLERRAGPSRSSPRRDDGPVVRSRCLRWENGSGTEACRASSTIC